MHIFRYPDYQSEATQFINQLKEKTPTLEADQQKGRALLWDKTIDRTQQNQEKAAKVSQKAYVYQTSPMQLNSDTDNG